MASYLKNDVQTKTKKRKIQSFWKQIANADLWLSSAAECLATFIFLFVYCISIMFPEQSREADQILAKKLEHTSEGYLRINIGIALTYAALVQCFENISGGFMNPAITVAMVIAGHIGVVKAVVYMLAQIAGAFSAVALCFGLFPNPNQQVLAISRLNENLTSLQGFGIEILLAFILTVAWLATYVTSKNHLGSSSLPVGVAYLSVCLWAGQLTGACTNPARALAPAILLQDWTNLWVYIAGPFTGCFVGAILYCQILSSSTNRFPIKNTDPTDRKAEGESVQSDRNASDVEVFESKSTTHVDADYKQIQSGRNIANSNMDLKQQNLYFNTSHFDPSVRRTSSTSVPNLHKIQHPPAAQRNHFVQSSLFLASNDASPAVENVATSTAPNSTNVTLTRGSLKRPNTACGVIIESNMMKTDKKTSLYGHKATAILGRRSESSTEPFSECTNSLLSDGQL